jgi:hypothetical protein
MIYAVPENPVVPVDPVIPVVPVSVVPGFPNTLKFDCGFCLFGLLNFFKSQIPQGWPGGDKTHVISLSHPAIFGLFSQSLQDKSNSNVL